MLQLTMGLFAKVLKICYSDELKKRYLDYHRRLFKPFFDIKKMECKTGFEYDDLYRLKEVECHDGKSSKFQYDKVGNRLSRRDSNTYTSYTYNADNQLILQSGTHGTVKMRYDAAGNMVSKIGGGKKEYFQYTADNLLKKYEKFTVSAGNNVKHTSRYKYSVEGLRIEKQVGQKVARYLYDGLNALYQMNQNNDVKVKYVNGLGIDKWLARIKPE